MPEIYVRSNNAGGALHWLFKPVAPCLWAVYTHSAEVSFVLCNLPADSPLWEYVRNVWDYEKVAMVSTIKAL